MNIRTAAIGAVAAIIAGALASQIPSQVEATARPSQPVVMQEDGDAASLDKQNADNDDNADKSLDKFMQKKLDSSSDILRGLMIEDFGLIERSADQLLDMSKAESWRASNDMMYLQHSNQFRNAVDELRTKSKKHSIDGASLAWVNVTMSCIQCHEWVRNIMLADNEVTLD